MQDISKNVSDNLPNTSSTTSVRVVWLEYLTIISCIAVVWVHVNARVIYNTSLDDSFTWWVSNIANSLGRWPVPIFVMTSGYFLLDPTKNYTIATFYKKRALRILAPLIFWSMFYIAFKVVKKHVAHEPIGMEDIVQPILAGRPSYHLWYLYMFVGLYLFSPFVKKVVSICRNGELVFFVVLLLLFSILVNTANYFIFNLFDAATNGSIFIVWFLSYLGYFVSGHLLGRIVNINIGVWSLIGILYVCIVFTAVGCYFLTTRYSFYPGQYFHSYLSPTVVIISLSVFLLGKKLITRIPRVTHIEYISTSMLGVYVIHPFIIECLEYLGLKATKMNPLLSIPLITLCVFLISLAISEVIKRIPYLRRII